MASTLVEACSGEEAAPLVDHPRFWQRMRGRASGERAGARGLRPDVAAAVVAAAATVVAGLVVPGKH
jgi:hypothetical protein